MHQRKDWKNDYTKVYNQNIGQGTFGKVYLVKSNSNSKLYAMKEINLKQYILNISLINRSYALDEGLKLIKLKIDHENIVKYYTSYVHDDFIYWIMEYCDGGTLRERINLYKKRKKNMNENLIWYWSIHILNGIKYLHKKGIIHRDLKPENIYIFNKKGVCKIGDFGFSKLVVESSVTENCTINYYNDTSDSEDDYYAKKSSQLEDHIVYKLINMSQVGTPSYMAPELRMLIDSHLAYSSIETVNKTIKLCEKHIFKGDIFSFGCILYEMAFLKKAYDNKFKLPEDCYMITNLNLDKNAIYSDDLKCLIKLCLTKNPQDRPTVNQLFSLEILSSRLDHDYVEYYKQQVIPSPSIDTKSNSLLCITANLDEFYKPISMKSLKYNQNLIVILAVKHVNSYCIKSGISLITSTLNTLSPFGNRDSGPYENYYDKYLSVDDDGSGAEEPRILIYSEYGQLLKEFNSFLTNRNSASRENFTYKIYDFCIDEENDHLYISTRKHGILRFNIVDDTHYLEDIVLDGRLDFSEMNNQDQNCPIFPTCLNLIEDESVFKQSMKTTGKRRLIFYDRISKRVISSQVDLTSQKGENMNRINCNMNAGLTLEQQYIRQMVSSSKELICLFDDLNLINVYDLKTLKLERTNRQKNNKSCVKNLMCLTLDSDGLLYSTNGKSIFNLTFNDFEQQQRLSPLSKKGENLSHTITWMTLLTNSKLVLLTDALQMEKSALFILKPVSNRQ